MRPWRVRSEDSLDRAFRLPELLTLRKFIEN